MVIAGAYPWAASAVGVPASHSKPSIIPPPAKTVAFRKERRLIVVVFLDTVLLINEVKDYMLEAAVLIAARMRR